jgi:hypothetical protein
MTETAIAARATLGPNPDQYCGHASSRCEFHNDPKTTTERLSGAIRPRRLIETVGKQKTATITPKSPNHSKRTDVGVESPTTLARIVSHPITATLETRSLILRFATKSCRLLDLRIA